MLSDDSSSDSETGRFKCRTKTQDDSTQSRSRDNSLRTSKDVQKSSGRNRRHENERYHRDFDRKRNEREGYDFHMKERNRFSRHSPVRRRRSRERSRHREIYERRRHERDPSERSKDHRSDSRDRSRRSESKTRKSPNHNQQKRESIQSQITVKKLERNDVERQNRSSSIEVKEKRSSSIDSKIKKSEIHKAVTSEKPVLKSKSPDIVEVHEDSDEIEDVKVGSYYNMIPIVKEKSEDSSEIDSSDDERLRAKLLNLEKEISKTKKKKHKKKHKKKSSKSSKDKNQEATASVEVSSTTDIQSQITDNKISGSEMAEVTSTQKNSQKESSEEGEILSDDEAQSPINIDSNDLRHKLKKSTMQANKLDVCGPALPPHLEKVDERASSPDIEGPQLPPHLRNKTRHIGPSIPQDMRKVLEEKSQEEVISFDSSDEDISIVGPLPAGSEEKWTSAHKKLEERALDMKIKKMDGHSLNKADVKSREKWMLELPEGKTKYLGLEARTFRAKGGPDMSDRSSWTDTPEEKAKKAAGIVKEEDADAALQREARNKQIANRDDEQEKAIKKHKKKHKRDESLLELHQKKLKKKKKKEDKDEEKQERRPFSRDVDLQVNRFDDAQKRSIIKKAQELDTRFSRGEAKYL